MCTTPAAFRNVCSINPVRKEMDQVGCVYGDEEEMGRTNDKADNFFEF